MAEVKVLLNGYLSNEMNGRCMPTMSIIRDKNVIMISDPGVVENQKVIVNALKKEGLKIEDINFVFITHSHLDHYRNIGMFPNAKVVEYFGIWEENKDAENLEENFSEDIKIIKTPGHNYDSLTMLVKTTKGIVAICGDVFWKENRPKKDPYATDLKKLDESRKKILKIADYIIPGHGKMFKVKK
jgi:glyoxylase-like metal-dependent hydrolase (beta-lactamase superfamily II)